MAKSINGRVVVVTGASSGIGREIAKYFANNGDKVFGLARSSFEEKNVKSISCDVTIKESVRLAIKEIITKEGHIDILINNAGCGVSGSVENSDIEDIKNMFNVNFFGAVSVTQEVLPFMREHGGGKIINTSSVASVIPIPFQSFYSATKSSLDIYAKALRLEVRPFNIEICNVLVGDTKSNFTSSRKKSQRDEGSVYEETVKRSVKKMENDEKNGKDPVSVAKTMFKLSLKKKLPPTKTVGVKYKLIVFLNKILPQKFMLFVVSKLYS